ncbi:hypothetical protein TNCV_4167661 [Trichonephila clavipes]|uniref:Uncharacterized protein n=1 Tax=Trichonephila clavipes TaxID=2585209 RepID=A0A8X6RCP3_TRICX|nr:hypothetical protein TNCV_4167661 [Trichonephila clavipes]
MSSTPASLKIRRVRGDARSVDLVIRPCGLKLQVRRQYFHRLYVTFSNCSTICGGLFWPRIKLFWIPLFGFNHFEPPKTQQLVSEVGLNANNKSDGGPVPDSSRKID